MTPGSISHLSEDALDDVLIGLGSPEANAHVATCAECRAEVQAFRGDLQLFNAASMAWSKSRWPKAQPTVPHAVRARVAFASWSAVAAVLVVVMAVAFWHQRQVPVLNQANTAQSLPVDSEAQIAQDNQLLQAINAAISPDETSPILEYKISERPHSHMQAHSRTRVK
jgi:hypothetical protein